MQSNSKDPIEVSKERKQQLENDLKDLDNEIEDQIQRLDSLKLENETIQENQKYYKEQINTMEKELIQFNKNKDKNNQESQQLEKNIQKQKLRQTDIQEKIKKEEHILKQLQEKQSQKIVIKPLQQQDQDEKIEPPEYRIFQFSQDNLLEPTNESEVSEDLKCMICQDIVNDPQECQNCQTLFCSQCIESWKKKRDQCPLNCDKPWNLRNPHKKYKQMLSELKFKCLFSDKGCDFKVSTDNIEQHKQSCKYWKLMIQTHMKDQLTKQKSQKFGQFFFQADDLEWIEFDNDLSNAFEENYKSNKKSFNMKYNGFKYSIDLKNMQQKNLNTKRVRNLKREEKSKSQQKQPNIFKKNTNNIFNNNNNNNDYDDDDDDEYDDEGEEESKHSEYDDDQDDSNEDEEWCWIDDQGEYQPYTEPAKSKIENAYQTYLRTRAKTRAILKLTISKTNYTIDFSKETQINASTGFQRKIRRI